MKKKTYIMHLVSRCGDIEAPNYKEALKKAIREKNRLAGLDDNVSMEDAVIVTELVKDGE